MYLISKDSELTFEYLRRCLQQFQTRELTAFNKSYRYYKGKQKILQKQTTDNGRTPNKIVVNYCNTIVKNYLGYLAGIPVRYENDKFEDVLKVLKYNDVHQEDTQLLKNALIYGRSFEVNYIDEDGKQRFKIFDTKECIPIYSNDLNNTLLYVVRFYREDLIDKLNQNYIVEVYSENSVKKYRSSVGFSSFELIEEIPHYYNQVPVTVFSLNDEEVPIFEQIITLQDAYNQLLSGGIDDFESFADAYLVLKGAIADGDDLAAMKKNRVLMLDTDADAHYLTKSITDTELENMLEKVDKHIHKIANSPDFTDENFMTQSGVAIRYKLIGFENQAADIESYMRKALQKRIELISEIFNLTNGEEVWRDVNIVFTRNLPQSLQPANIPELMQLKGTISDKTLISQLPFINDVDEELEQVETDRQNNIELYSFTNPKIDEDEDEED